MITLGIESSCDDTSLALVEDGVRIIESLVSSQIEIHRRFGGVVPEVASRKHLEAINPMFDELFEKSGKSISDVSQVAVTAGPGLLGALLVGLSAAKAIAWKLKLPLIPVNHLEAHLSAAFLARIEPPTWPFLGLVVSGGHSNLVIVRGAREFQNLGRTVDDAPGELFDKIARHLDIGYPGGPAIQKVGEHGDPHRYALPRPMAGKGYGFSFSGLKTAVLRVVQQEKEQINLPDLCASLQEAVGDTVIGKIEAALDEFRIGKLVIAGGVAANAVLRKKASDMALKRGVELLIPPLSLCSDNSAMVAANGFFCASCYSRKKTPCTGLQKISDDDESTSIAQGTNPTFTTINSSTSGDQGEINSRGSSNNLDINATAVWAMGQELPK
ncbi:MAG: tRNA (adenosine(37)-N6)-threonylcarbamoyltransferase complex transferase subunit TsaD [Candidatus Riflebacteria bacterium]|nr:tRNA (adenosine(37)-N6)-threonylcarbamoyltransferase complex transferase subunit TsaD [Candidatus Riflebacteria bacterium]